MGNFGTSLLCNTHVVLSVMLITLKIFGVMSDLKSCLITEEARAVAYTEQKHDTRLLFASGFDEAETVTAVCNSNRGVTDDRECSGASRRLEHVCHLLQVSSIPCLSHSCFQKRELACP